MLLFLFHCSSGPQLKVENPAPGKEYVGDNEDKISERTLELMINSIKEKAKQNNTIVRRDAHPKHHGCVSGKFTVLDSVPEELKAGVFAKPESYDTWMRFSNGATDPGRDDKGDIRGAGIKLLGVKGDKILENKKKAKTQDFLLISHTVLPVGDPQEYLDLFEAAIEKRIMGYFFGWNPFAWKLSALGKVRAIRGKTIPNMLEIRYWSTTPYRLGNKLAVKYSIIPCGGERKDMPDTSEENYLRNEMKKTLDGGEACFNFMVQKQGDPKEFPVEDPSYEWNEEVSPFIKVAEIKIPS
ncbi:MAG: catalase [Leptospiraceae bacterium]|nr:catalase [Leptospiraceae bacterium]